MAIAKIKITTTLLTQPNDYFNIDIMESEIKWQIETLIKKNWEGITIENTKIDTEIVSQG